MIACKDCIYAVVKYGWIRTTLMCGHEHELHPVTGKVMNSCKKVRSGFGNSYCSGPDGFKRVQNDRQD